MRAWQICPKWQMAIGAAAKCGSTMLADLVQANSARRLNVPDARQGRECWSMVPKSYRKVFVVRHPVSRFLSLYANIAQRKREPMNFYKQLEGLSPWDCFDKLIQLSPDLMYDVHFQPQHVAAGHQPEGASEVEYVRLESFRDWWKEQMPDTIQPRAGLNASVPVDLRLLDDKTAARVKKRYEFDLGLWEKAWASSADSSVNAPSP